MGREVALAPDARRRSEQERVARREAQNADLVQARLRELGDEALKERFRPYLDAFFAGTAPSDWLEAKAFTYVGDALVSDLADVVVPLVDPVSAEVLRRALWDRRDEEAFALEEIVSGLDADPSARDRVAEYCRRIVGEAFTQTSRALGASPGLRALLGGPESGKRFLLSLLDRHRQRLDRLGIERIEED